MRLRRKRFAVQLHVVTRTGNWMAGTNVDRITHSYTPIAARNLTEARNIAHRLRQDNRWGGLMEWPHVTIHDSEGERYREVAS